MLRLLSSLFARKAELPAHWASIPWHQARFLAVDLEFTHLQAAQSDILSVGWVAGRACQIELASGFYQVVATDASLHQSPVIHGLTEEDVREGEPLERALEKLSPLADDHIWVFHNAQLDLEMLQTAFAQQGMPMPDIVVIDTLKYALHQMNKQHQPIPPDGLTLAGCRQRYHLPKAPAHNALDDAHATLELLFAMLCQHDPRLQQLLADLPCVSALQGSQD